MSLYLIIRRGKTLKLDLISSVETIYLLYYGMLSRKEKALIKIAEFRAYGTHELVVGLVGILNMSHPSCG
jgi:hypothetical protein